MDAEYTRLYNYLRKDTKRDNIVMYAVIQLLILLHMGKYRHAWLSMYDKRMDELEEITNGKLTYTKYRNKDDSSLVLVYNKKYEKEIIEYKKNSDKSRIEYFRLLGEILGYPCPWYSNKISYNRMQFDYNRLVCNIYVNNKHEQLLVFVCNDMRIDKILWILNYNIKFYMQLRELLSDISDKKFRKYAKLSLEIDYLPNNTNSINNRKRINIIITSGDIQVLTRQSAEYLQLRDYVRLFNSIYEKYNANRVKLDKELREQFNL